MKSHVSNMNAKVSTFKWSLKRSMSPILILGNIFGFSPAVNRISLQFLYNVFALFVFSIMLSLVMQEIFVGIQELSQDLLQYGQLGINFCSFTFLFVSSMFVAIHMKNSNKIIKFYDTGAKIDDQLEKYNQKISYKIRFSVYLSVVIITVLAHSLLITIETTHRHLNVNIIPAYLVESYGYVVHMTFFSAHVSEMTARYKNLNKTLER